MTARRAIPLALILSACAGPPPEAPPAPVPRACEEPLRAALTEIAALREEGRYSRALGRIPASETACEPLDHDVNEARLDLLYELGEDERAIDLATSLAANPDTPAKLAGKAREIAARPPRPRTRADLREGDALREKNELGPARAAYERAVAASPRDPRAQAALGEIALAAGDRVAARLAFDRAIRAAGALARFATFEPEHQRGPVVTGTLRPELLGAGLLHRVAAGGAIFPAEIVGPMLARGPDALLFFGEGHALAIGSRDGREVRVLGIRDVKDAAFSPGDGSILTLSEGSVKRLDRATGLVAARIPASGKSIDFAGPSRLVVDTEVFELPSLAKLFTIPENANLGPGVIAYHEMRPAKKGQSTFIVVKSAADGRVLFERDLKSEVWEPQLAVHPSGRFVAWIGEAWADKETQGSILDVAAKKLTPFPYHGIHRVQIAALRITADGKATCAFDLGWTASRHERGKESLCWSRDREAVLVLVKPTAGFEIQHGGEVHGGLSPDGKLAAFAEARRPKDGPAKVAVRVVDVATARDVSRFEVGEPSEYQIDAFFASSGVIQVWGGDTINGFYDARSGARVERPKDAREQDIGVLTSLTDQTWVGREHPRIISKHGVLELTTGKHKSCWTVELREAEAKRCENGPANDVDVTGGLARVPGRLDHVRLSLPIKSARGFVARVGKVDLLVVPQEWMARYFSMTGELLGTVAAVGPGQLVAFVPGGVAAFVGAGAEKSDFLACVAGDVALPLAACDERRIAREAFLRWIEGDRAAIDR